MSQIPKKDKKEKKRKPNWKEQHLISDKGTQVPIYFLVCFRILRKTSSG